MFYSPKNKKYKFSYERKQDNFIKENVKEDKNIPEYILKLSNLIQNIENKNYEELKTDIKNIVKSIEKNLEEKKDFKEKIILKKFKKIETEIENITEEKKEEEIQKEIIKNNTKKFRIKEKDINLDQYKKTYESPNVSIQKNNESLKSFTPKEELDTKIKSKEKLLQYQKNLQTFNRKLGSQRIIKNIKNKIRLIIKNFIDDDFNKKEKKKFESLKTIDIKTLLPVYKRPKKIYISESNKNEFEHLYKIRFGLIFSKDIYNLASPEHVFPLDEEEKENKILKKKIEELYVNHFNKKIKFYQKLEESIRKDGLRNPIIVNSYLPRVRSFEEVETSYIKKFKEEKRLFCEFLGGSRLYICQKNNWYVPCIIVDWKNGFSDFQELKTKEEIMEKFIDETDVKFTDNGLSVQAPTQVHLEKDIREQKNLTEIRKEFFLKINKEEIKKLLEQKYGKFKK
ncbi:MAG: hypothetical protein NZZ41_00300 [Candidatus Dojkabacteria bacterium]|nr:hypothetical protein [Candidatus Dojkabacteria bacterium]